MQLEEFLGALPASPQEAIQLEALDKMLLETASHTNLVARSSLDERFIRHYLDSAQLFPLLPQDGRSYLDFGSGAGFPGLILAIMASARHAGARWTLCDSVGKKTRFLQRVVDDLPLLNTDVLTGRVEVLARKKHYDGITARAVAALSLLLELSTPLLKPGGLLVFPKGKRAQQEVDDAREQWSFDVEFVPSRTDKDASILLIRSPQRKT